MDIDAQRAQRLFQAVVAQALVDATSEPALAARPIKRRDGETLADYRSRREKAERARKSALQEDLRVRDVARRWFLEAGADFRHICTLADYEPAAVRDRAARLADNEWKSVRRKAA